MASIAMSLGAKPLTTKAIAKRTGIPSHYLSKILRKLVEARLLQGTKGHNGGFILARPPAKIRLSDVLSAVEMEINLKHCIFGWRMCNAKEPCILHERWSTVKEAFYSWARETTLENIQKDSKNKPWLENILPQREES
jgi:Rrf2 family protein